MKNTFPLLCLRSRQWRHLCVAAVLWCCLFGWSAHASAQVAFQWGMQGGLRFNYYKNNLNLLNTPPSFDQDIAGGSILLGLIGLLQLGPYVELSATIDIGELLLANQSQPNPANPGSRQSIFAVLLNDSRLNLTYQEQVDQRTFGNECRRDAAARGIPLSECDNPFFLLQEGMFLREFYATFYLDKQQWIKIEAGILGVEIGRAFVFENYGIGVRFDANWSKRKKKQALPIHFRFEALLPNSSWTAAGKMSPTLHTKLAYVFQEDFEVGLFGAYLYDGNNLAGKILLPIWKERFARQFNRNVGLRNNGEEPSIFCHQALSQQDLNKVIAGAPGNNQQVKEALANAYINGFDQVCRSLPRSSGHHLWVGAEGRWRWQKKLTVEGAAILYVADIKIDIPSTQARRNTSGDISDLIKEQELAALGFAGELKVSYKWIPAFSTALFFLFATGDQSSGTNDTNTTINAFMGIAPQVRYTNVFFNGGINAYSSKRGIGISGISGKGYIVPGITFAYEIEDKVEAKITGALLWSVHPSIFTLDGAPSGSFYGGEINITGSYNVTEWLKPVIQLDFFMPGSFFAGSAPPGLLFRLLVGLDFTFLG